MRLTLTDDTLSLFTLLQRVCLFLPFSSPRNSQTTTSSSMVSPVPAPRYKTVVTGYPLSQHHHQSPSSTAYPVLIYHPTTAATSSFLCRLLAAVAAAFLLVSAISLLLFLILHPKLPSLRVDSAELAESNSSSLNPTLSLTFLFKNPNLKLSLSYTNLDAFLRYGDRGDVASTSLPPFSQATREETRVRAQLVLGQGIVVGEKGNNGSVEFGVKVFASVRFSCGVLRSRDRALMAACYPVRVVFDGKGNGTGTMVGPSDWCSV